MLVPWTKTISKFLTCSIAAAIYMQLSKEEEQEEQKEQEEEHILIIIRPLNIAPKFTRL